ncbi:MAG TPA: hypothetical protein VD886_08755 [Herpetosiphonaceae bacterium]|nr:hypothetical protein [Herpetosiphonaceae bacterium]
MGYEVPQSPPAPRRLPYLYIFISIIFHAWVILRGRGIIMVRVLSGHGFYDWNADQKLLFLFSCAILALCVANLIRPMRAAWLIGANGIYMVLATIFIAAQTSSGGIIESIITSPYLFAGVLRFLTYFVLGNMFYTLYRILRFLRQRES